MDRYRAEIRRRQVWLMAAEIGFLLLITLPRVFGSTEHPAAEGFQCGLSSVLLIFCSIRMVFYRKVLQDETALKRMYAEEHDERMQAIRAKAGLPLTFWAAAAMLAAGIAAGYFSFTVFCTLVAAALFLMLLSGAVKLVFRRKMTAQSEDNG